MDIFARKYAGAALVLFFWVAGAFGQHKPTVVPMQRIGGLPYLELSINGQGPFLFGLDTGFGAGLELDADLAGELNVKASGQTSVGDGSGQNEITLQTAKIGQVAIDGYTVKNCTAILRKNARKKVPGMENVKGIVGMALFSDYTITLDYPNNLFVIQKDALPKANSSDIFNYTEVGGGVPQIQIKIGSHEVNAAIDSRSMSGTFKLPQQLVDKLTFLNRPIAVGKGQTVSNTIAINQVSISESIRFGEFVFERPTVTYPSLNENAIIGSKLLQEFAITIDCKNKRIQFKKAGLSPTPNAVQDDPSLAEYTGAYGERSITLENGFLHIQRPNGVLLKMLPKSKDEFTLERVPEALLVFERDVNNRIKSIKVSKGDNHWETAEKNP